MLDYALSFYQDYSVVFYFLLTVVVLLEGPIVILTLTFLSSTLGIGLPVILGFALLGDFGGDMIHFYLGKYGKKLMQKLPFDLSSPTLSKITAQIENYPLLEKLIIIKYTPPITSAGLIYLGTSKLSTREFAVKDFVLCMISSLLVVGIGLFGSRMVDPENIAGFLMIFGVCLALTVFGLRLLTKMILKKIYPEADK